MLEASGIRRAKMVAVCTNKREITDRIVDLIKSEFPDAQALSSAPTTARIRWSSGPRASTTSCARRSNPACCFGQKTLEALGMDEDTAGEILEDVRRRDEERLALQPVEGLAAGRDRWLTKPVTPEPLIKPTRESRRIDKAPPVESPEPAQS